MDIKVKFSWVTYSWLYCLFFKLCFLWIEGRYWIKIKSNWKQIDWLLLKYPVLMKSIRSTYASERFISNCYLKESIYISFVFVLWRGIARERWILKDWWMDDLRLYVLCNSISIISGRWLGDNESCVQRNLIYVRKDFRLEPVTVRSVGQRLIYWATGALSPEGRSSENRGTGDIKNKNKAKNRKYYTLFNWVCSCAVM